MFPLCPNMILGACDILCYGLRMNSTSIRQHIKAPRALVYRALLDAEAVAKWMVPEGITSQVIEFDPRQGGRFRISLTYDAPTATGKTTAHTDTHNGRFVSLVKDESVVETIEFETTAPEMQGKMMITITLADAEGGTDLPRCMMEFHPAYLLPTTRLAGSPHLENWRLFLKEIAAVDLIPIQFMVTARKPRMHKRLISLSERK
jgi:uncharacterized protein YndB with AHSA1/START domain